MLPRCMKHPCIITSSPSCPAIGNQCNYLQLCAIKLLKCFSTFSTIKLLNLNFNCRLVLFMSIVRVGSERVLTDEPVYVLCSASEVARRDLSGSCLSHRPILVTQWQYCTSYHMIYFLYEVNCCFLAFYFINTSYYVFSLHIVEKLSSERNFGHI